MVAEHALWVGLGCAQEAWQGRKPGPHKGHGQPALADAVHRHAHRRQGRVVESLHLVEEEDSARTAALRDLTHLDQQHCKVALWIATVRRSSRRFDIEPGAEPARHPD